MTIAVFLIPYLLFLVIWIFFSLLIMGKLLTIVKDSAPAGLLLLVYIMGSALILATTWYFVATIEWGAPLTIF
ncbi:MAG: hypothetical protein AAB870_00745 [Patescibacteria group bacterium]